jgi:DNA-directed RNA polymerase subunit RPC12/RpoP
MVAKTKGKTAGRGSAKPEPKKKARGTAGLYKCKTCGALARERGHLCAPESIDKAYECEYCGLTVSNPRHVCKPKVAEMSYVCDGCGRVAVEKGQLCKPKAIK